MVKQTYKEKLLDPRWQKKRLKLLEQAGWACEDCGNTDKTLHIHHLYYNTNGDPWDVADDDLMCLCCDCHEAVEFLPKLTLEERELYDYAFWISFFSDKRDISRLHSIILDIKKKRNG